MKQFRKQMQTSTSEFCVYLFTIHISYVQPEGPANTALTIYTHTLDVSDLA